MYIVHEIVDKYSNTCHKINKTKPADVDIKHNEQDPKFKIGDHLKILKYNFFAKFYTPTWSEDVCVIKKVRKILHRGLLCVIKYYMLLKTSGMNKLLENVMKKSWKRQVRIVKLIKKSDKLFVKSKGHDPYKRLGGNVKV